MIIAIDGPAGSGKSTIAQAVAERLGLTYLDTGAMYRAVTFLALEQGVSLEDDDGLGVLALEMDLAFRDGDGGPPRVLLGDRDVSDEIRSPTVSQKVSLVAAHQKVRQALTVRQRTMAGRGDAVLEGRDIGTVVCPQAPLKVYLTASIEERARRRHHQLEEQGVRVSLKDLEREILLRDSHDSGRVLAPLRRAKDALVLDTTTLSIDEVVDRIAQEAARITAPTRPTHEPTRSTSGGPMIASPLDSGFYRVLHAFVPGLVIRLLHMEIVGEHHLPRHGPVVLASNHLSNLDPVILGVASPRQIHFMAKAEIWKVPLVGRLVETLGSFPVHRGEADREAVRRGLEVLKAGAVLGIFPEGHRQPEGYLGQAQPGVALFSLRPGVKTVPVAVVGTSRIMQGWRPTRAKVTVTFGPPLDLVGVAGSKADQHRALTGRLMAALAGLLGQTWPPGPDHADEGRS